MTFQSFLDRLVRRIPAFKHLEEENKLLRKYFDRLEDKLDTAGVAHEALADRVKELEEEEYQTEADVQNTLDEQDPWNDPSFTGGADKWLAEKFSFDRSDGSGPSPRRRPSH